MSEINLIVEGINSGIEILRYASEYWMDMNTGDIYEIDADTSVGMSFLNDEDYCMMQIPKEKYDRILTKNSG